MQDSSWATLMVAAALLAGAIWIAVKLRGQLAQARSEVDATRAACDDRLRRYEPLIDLEAEQDRVTGEIATERGRLDELRTSYADKRSVYDRLQAELAIIDDRLAFAEMGVYEPHFEFTDSETYKAAIAAVREQQKQMITAKTAVYCTTNWTVDGSTSKGQSMSNRAIRLTLRAFNNEGDAAVANTRWNNVNAMAKRVVNARTQIDKLNASNAVVISDAYLKLKLEELFLTHEHREKLKAERDERAEQLRLARDEQKLQRDLERAEEQQSHYAKLLAAARTEAEQIVGPKLDAYTQQIEALERDLAEAQAKAERAKALAEQTRSGYVYIISNIGSFGEGVVKIGLTRRLDPIDRVRELGDASVPFTFDTHAVIYSDDAPSLERALHAEFEATRINAQNLRKEFFRAPVEEVEMAVKRLAPDATFFRDIEAQEYRETLARRAASLDQPTADKVAAFPVDL